MFTLGLLGASLGVKSKARLALNDLRIHDLRHAAASIAVNEGDNLGKVGRPPDCESLRRLSLNAARPISAH